MRFISTKNRPLFIVFSVGLISTVVQCVFLREYLSVFQGNELSLGFICSVWLSGSALGSSWGVRKCGWSRDSLIAVLLIFIITGLTGIRASRFFTAPGSSSGPLEILLIIVITQTGPAFFNGAFFGYFSRKGIKIDVLYALDNSGDITGAFLVFILTIFSVHNGYIMALSLLPLLFLVKNKNGLFIFLAIFTLLFAVFDSRTVRWKYPFPVIEVNYTPEGEAVTVISEKDTSIMLNNSLYKTSIETGTVEQSVHVPAAQQREMKDVLIIYNRNYKRELLKYDNIDIDIIESMPFFIDSEAVVTAPEKYRPDKKYDMILLGADIPETASENRVFTVSFFRHIKSLLKKSGVFSFTLQFSPNYMSKNERMMYEIIINTLRSSFEFVHVFPGEGYTFMASNEELDNERSVNVKTEYFENYILPSVTKGRIEAANPENVVLILNTVSRPSALFFALKNWISRYRYSTITIIVLLLIVLISAYIIMPFNLSVISVSTSGFISGFYSMAVMILFQAEHGTLYRDVSLLLMTLTLGFVAGSRMKKFPFSDISIGVYSILSLIILVSLPNVNLPLFMAADFGIGFVTAAQFVTREYKDAGILNASDLMGGVLGMSMATTLLIPLWGVVPVIIVSGILKISLGGVCCYMRR